jgi:hypothetical protein
MLRRDYAYMAGHIQDRWFKTETDAAGKAVKTKTDRHGTGLRYRARYVGPDGTEKSKSFRDKELRLAKQWLANIEADMSRGQYVDPRAARRRSGSTPNGGSRPTPVRSTAVRLPNVG